MADSGGVQLSYKGVHFSVSQGALNTLADAWYYTLDWISQNPVQFIEVLALIALLLFLRHKTKVETTQMQTDYNQRRIAARNREPPLPLPKPGEKKNG